MYNTLFKIDSYLMGANIAQADKVSCPPMKIDGRSGDFIILSIEYEDRHKLIRFWEFAKQVFEGDLQAIYRYEDAPEEKTRLPGVPFFYIITKETAEKLCDRFQEIIAVQGIHPKYMEPIYYDKEIGNFEM